jgi:hypothetical protein
MSRIETEIVAVNKSQEEVFNKLNDFNTFKHVMPEQVTNWQSTSDTCSFKIAGMATVGMRRTSSTPHDQIHIVSEGGKLPFDFILDTVIKSTSETTCTVQLIFEADINMFLKPMVEPPLRNFFNMVAAKMKNLE